MKFLDVLWIGIMIAIILGAAQQPACAIDVVLGDSLSVGEKMMEPWPDKRFMDHINVSVSGASLADFIEVCDPDCWWAQGDSDATWWILIGHNDEHDQLAYINNLFELMWLVKQQTGASDFRLISSCYSWQVVQADQRAWQDAMAEADVAVCNASERMTCDADLRFGTHPDAGHFQRDLVHFSEAGHEQVAILVPEPSQTALALVGLLTVCALFVVGGL
jgi:hypothetical protein